VSPPLEAPKFNEQYSNDEADVARRNHGQGHQQDVVPAAAHLHIRHSHEGQQLLDVLYMLSRDLDGPLRELLDCFLVTLLLGYLELSMRIITLGESAVTSTIQTVGQGQATVRGAAL
jgi:hypothetical protein